MAHFPDSQALCPGLTGALYMTADQELKKKERPCLVRSFGCRRPSSSVASSGPAGVAGLRGAPFLPAPASRAPRPLAASGGVGGPRRAEPCALGPEGRRAGRRELARVQLAPPAMPRDRAPPESAPRPVAGASEPSPGASGAGALQVSDPLKR